MNPGRAGLRPLIACPARSLARSQQGFLIGSMPPLSALNSLRRIAQVSSNSTTKAARRASLVDAAQKTVTAEDVPPPMFMHLTGAISGSKD
jgi:hypothetical protein